MTEGDAQLVLQASIQLPGFWKDDPEAWFTSAESQFAIRGITKEVTKFHHVIAKLEPQTVSSLVGSDRTLVTSTPKEEDTPYTKVKAELIRLHGLSDEQRAARILDTSGLGDQKPSEVMNRMLALLGGRSADFLLRHLFLRRLPEQVRGPVSSLHRDLPLLGKEADRVWLATSNCQTVASVQDEVQAVKQKPSNSKPTDSSAGKCWYHRTHGEKARKCIPPCNWAGKRPSGQESKNM